jgi:hypothetical protein
MTMMMFQPSLTLASALSSYLFSVFSGSLCAQAAQAEL